MDWVSYSQAISTCVSTKDADLLVKAGEIYRLRSEAAATSHGEEAVFLDGTWDLVDEDGDDMLVDKATALRVA